jgi:anti-repressor protein
MSNLIPINYDNDRQTVSGRDLHTFLNIGKDYTTWVKDWMQYDFAAGVDFTTFYVDKNGDSYFQGFQGFTDIDRMSGADKARNGYTTNHQISIDCAKEICMLARSEKGRQARQYFIELEKAWNSPEAVMARALKMADNKILSLQSAVNEMKPKADFFDAVANSKDAIEIGQAAKVLNFGKGRNTLFAILREENILRDNNEPYQEYIDRGYFRTIEQKYAKPGGETCINIKTLVYQRGLDYIRKILDRRKSA